MAKLRLKPKDRSARGKLRIEKPEQQPVKGKDSSGEKFTATDEHRAQVEALAAFGIPQTAMCRLVLNPRTGKPISVHTLERRFRDELELGLSKAIAAVASCLFELATNPGPSQPTAIIFWLRTRARWRETERIELSGVDGAPITTSSKLELRAVFRSAKKEEGRVFEG